MQAAFKLLNTRQKRQIHKYTLELLATVGVEIGKPEIRELLLKNGAVGAGGARVLLGEEMVMSALSQCPASFSVFGNDGREYPVGGGFRPLISTCLVDPFMNAPEGNRRPVLRDCARNARIINGEPLIDIPYKMDVAYSDVPEADCVALSNLAVFSNMVKPFIQGPQTKRDGEITLAMAAIMAPGPLSEKPNVLTMISPSSPLALHRDCLEMLESAVSYHAPVICLPCPMNGLTSPVSVAGTILTVNAENLALITVIQLLNPGHKTIYHTVAMPADVKTLEARMTGPEKMLDTVGAAEMGRYYGLPVGLPISSTDVSAFDIQNGAESMSQVLTGILSGADLITGVGSNTNACGTSIEQILLDCEMLRLAMRLKRGVDFKSLKEGFDALKRVGPGGSFIGDDDTLEALKLSGEIYSPELFCWRGHKDCALGAVDKARAKAEMLSALPVDVDEKKLAALKRFVREEVLSLE
jgi:trimethylamine--corrinoid protein Co-methyltransferase